MQLISYVSGSEAAWYAQSESEIRSQSLGAGTCSPAGIELLLIMRDNGHSRAITITS